MKDWEEKGGAGGGGFPPGINKNVVSNSSEAINQEYPILG